MDKNHLKASAYSRDTGSSFSVIEKILSLIYLNSLQLADNISDWVSLLWVCCITFNIFLTAVFTRRGEKFEK